MVATNAALAGVQERIVSVLPRKKEDVEALSYLLIMLQKHSEGTRQSDSTAHADGLLVQARVCQLDGHLHHTVGRNFELLHL